MEIDTYRFQPCCGGHPIYVTVEDQNGDAVIFPFGVGKVYQFTPPSGLPYNGGPISNNESLIPGQCYRLDKWPLDEVYIPQLNPCPPVIAPGDNWTDTEHELCDPGAKQDPKCGCAQIYEFVSCCTGESTIYNIVGSTGAEIVSGTTYSVALDLSDLSTVGCYTISAITVEDPELVPTINIANIGYEDPILDACDNFICFLLCQECRCQTFSSNQNVGVYNVYTCDLLQASIVGTVSGPVISYDGGVTYNPLTEPLCLKYYVEATPGITRIDSGLCETVYWDSEGSQFNCPTAYKIVNCEDESEQYCVSNDLSTEFAANLVLTVNGQTFANKCWRIEETAPCPQTITISFSITDISCETCLEKIQNNYELINCSDGNVIVYTSTNLEVYAGSIISLDEYPEDCWYVQVLTTSIPSDIPVTFSQQFPDCETCTTPQYLLEDCDIDNPDPNIITNVDLSAYVGQIITLLNCPDKCWLVSQTDPIPTPQFVNVTNSYQTCELCIQPAPEPEPPVYTYKSITPGYNTPGCSPEKFERYVCNFSEAMYRQIMVDAYGITPCCGEDDIKYEIKYELIKLKAIQDPDYNCKLTSSCECTTSTNGLTPCIPAPVACHIYIVTILSYGDTSFTIIGCDGTEQTVLVLDNKVPVEYNVCGIAGQTIAAPVIATEFSYVETSITCT